MAKALKNRASKQAYVSTRQPLLEGFETPFSKQLNACNRWVVLAKKIPWDHLVNVYGKQMSNHKTGADGINPRVVFGSLIIKHMCCLSDRETIQQIQENMYMQYFIGYNSFSDEAPFDASLFVEIRNRLGIDQINAINEKIIGLTVQNPEGTDGDKTGPTQDVSANLPAGESTDVIASADTSEKAEGVPPITHQGKMIVDATACPQDISYPTDLNLLSDAREKSEALIDFLHRPLVIKKPRTYRQEARKIYLKTAQKKAKSRREIRNAIKKQLGYLRRNIKNIHMLLNCYDVIPFNCVQHKYFFVIQTLYEQQLYMYENKSHSVAHRIVSIHQPHVRPIVRGKTNANVEFGAKIQVSLMNGYAFLEDLSWEAYNEGTRLITIIEQYKKRLGYYPQEVAADKIYCNRANRGRLKELGIRLRAKALGRPSAVKTEHVSPGERNPIEGKFGQAKTAYGMNRIKARLQGTSESWIATIVLVLNLVKLTREVLYCLFIRCFTYSIADLKIIALINNRNYKMQRDHYEKSEFFDLFSRP